MLLLSEAEGKILPELWPSEEGERASLTRGIAGAKSLVILLSKYRHVQYELVLTVFLSVTFFRRALVLPLPLVMLGGNAYKWQRIVKIRQWQRLRSYGTWLKGRPLQCMLRVVRKLSFGCVVHGDAYNSSALKSLKKGKE